MNRTLQSLEASLLLANPDLLLLDGPTNHLDLEARNWLEEFLVGYPHAVILVSHDRYFLDAVATRIAELNLRTLTDYTGNYNDYLRESQARLDRLRQLKREQDEEVARVKLFIDRFRYQATKAAQVQSRIKLLEKVLPVELPPARKRVRFTFPPCPKSGRLVLSLTHARKAYDDKVVFRDLTLHVERGDRIALLGPNGASESKTATEILGPRYSVAQSASVGAAAAGTRARVAAAPTLSAPRAASAAAIRGRKAASTSRWTSSDSAALQTPIRWLFAFTVTDSAMARSGARST